jgi:hypothetical protein
MSRVDPREPILDSSLAGSIAAWLQQTPRQLLAELADSETREEAAARVSKMIVAKMTVDYPEFVDAVEPTLPF